MKLFKSFSLALIASSIMLFTSCSSDDNVTPGVDPEPEPVVGVIGDGSYTYTITKDVVYKKGTYSLKGWVYVKNGATVTFEPGTIIKGEKGSKASLIIEPGSKIYAQGTATEPIVFTSAQPKGSRKPGDWGGLIICGYAKNNNGAQLGIEGGPTTKHGGDNDDDNSGILSYVRVEFAGSVFDENQEINGVTFGSVGRATKVDHVQVSYSNDDSFEWFGGSVSAKYLIAYHGWDDDFDTDNGFSGKLQYLLAVRNPKIADTSLSNGFESDNNKPGTDANPKTSTVFSNVTLVGPIGQANDFMNTMQYINAGNYRPDNISKTGLFQAAMQIRRYSQLSCFNSVAMGFPVGLLLDNQNGNTQGLAKNGTLKINNVFFAQMGVVGSDVNNSLVDKYSTNGKDMTDAQSFSHTYFVAQPSNKVLANISDLKLKQPNSLLSNANWGPTTGSPLLGAASFTDALLNGFEQVDYVGAFKSDADSDNWTKGWANFDPQNTEY
ncbi:hypothetical protein [Dysgonomonas sp. ZJ279]|uniref:hypothetical protein n=1 Tax=Dysgonomonas sp. ZJ279 TaxID=2709796 RepID=UPI0013EBD17D|nr:hypothetical protein [Dysgonomonas sp. ZJ279]